MKESKSYDRQHLFPNDGERARGFFLLLHLCHCLLLSILV
jgi:hypothetical protein